MTKPLRIASALLAVFAALFVATAALAAQALAATSAGQSSEIGFFVRAHIPDNQIDKNLTYFDLRVAPGQAQQLEVDVVNDTDTPITVGVQAISASTNRNGIIDYKTPDIRDKTLAIPFSTIAGVGQPNMTIPANSTQVALVKLDMPQNSFDGVVLGGLVFTRLDEAGVEATQSGMALNNVFSYVIGVKLTETDTEVLPDFEFEGVEAQSVNYQPATVHFIRNTQAAIMKNMSLDVTIRDSAGAVQAQVSRTGVDMAPNSVMPLAVTMAGGLLTPGDYTSEIVLEKDGQVWNLEASFTIAPDVAQEVNDALPTAPETGFFSPAVILICCAFLLLLGVIIFLLLLLLRRRKEDEEEENETEGSQPDGNSGNNSDDSTGSKDTKVE